MFIDPPLTEYTASGLFQHRRDILEGKVRNEYRLSYLFVFFV